jgi:hypothetical protein
MDKVTVERWIEASYKMAPWAAVAVMLGLAVSMVAGS